MVNVDAHDTIVHYVYHCIDQLRSSAPSRRKRPLSDCSNDSILSCNGSLPNKRLSLSRGAVNVSVDNNMEENEPVVSLDYVSF